MSRYRFELATRADDADLREVLAATPMPGRVALRFRREPSFFDAADVDGSWRQVILARDCEQGRVIGLGSRSVREMYVNGAVCSVGYLSNLRVLPEYRGSSVMARGYQFLRRIHADGRARLYLTTIADDNHRAKVLLTSGRAGLPAYHDLGRYFTFALPLARRLTYVGREQAKRSSGMISSNRRSNAGTALRLFRPTKATKITDTSPPGVQLRRATADDLLDVIRFYESAGPRRQFFPRYDMRDFVGASATFRGFEPNKLILAFRNRRLVGTLGLWDQHAFRQTEIESYGAGLRWTRPLLNCWARFRGLPGLPPAGSSLRYGVTALPVVQDDDPHVLLALLNAQRRAAVAGAYPFLLFGIHERDPLCATVRSQSCAEYVTRLYVVCFDEAASIRQSLDDRCPYLELGCL